MAEQLGVRSVPERPRFGEHSIDGLSLSEAVAEINRANRETPSSVTDPPSTFEVQPFVGLAQQLADSIIQVYEQQLSEIQSKLEDAKIIAQDIRRLSVERANDINEFRHRAEIFAKAVLTANAEFTKGEQK